ncbi:MAG: hypothetical protein ACR2NB_09200 [Solirubrobacteraceae bacterium]
MIPISHAGHWLVNLAYALPAFVLLAALGIAKLRDWRRGRGPDPKP